MSNSQRKPVDLWPIVFLVLFIYFITDGNGCQFNLHTTQTSEDTETTSFSFGFDSEENSNEVKETDTVEPIEEIEEHEDVFRPNGF